jgi:hypothetical protein
MHRWKLLLVPLLGLASLQAMACYTVYDRTNRILYQSDVAPIDMSRPLHETMPARFPAGAQLVFDTSAAYCPAVVVSSVAIGNGGPVTRTQSPLLTDEHTARRLGLPHRSLGNNIALVPPASVAMEPGVTVVPAVTASIPSLRTPTVITEYRNPPVTVTRRGDEVIVSENQ